MRHTKVVQAIACLWVASSMIVVHGSGEYGGDSHISDGHGSSVEKRQAESADLSGQVCQEGSCKARTSDGSVQVCGSQRWQEQFIGPGWTCLAGRLTSCSNASTLVNGSPTSSTAGPRQTLDSTFDAQPQPKSYDATAPIPSASAAGDPGGLKSMIYYPNWALYARKFFPKNIIRVGRFSYIFYAFANVSPDGTVPLDDPYSDLEISDGLSAAKGCIDQLQELERDNPELKLILSIGGYSYSPNFAVPASTPSGRDVFARSAVELLKKHKFDGLDIDWEYPENQEQGEHFYQLLAATREELNRAGGKSNILTTAVSVNPVHNRQLPIEKMDKVLDFWLLMGYDYSGAFDKITGHSANVFPSADKQSTPFDTDSAVKAYKEKGVSPSKLILGMPLYGHDFVGTDGPGQPFASVSDGSWGAGHDGPTGIWDYKAIADTDPSNLKIDRDLIASWSYDSNTRTMISYDTPEVASLKAKYILETGLGGAMWWEITGDIPGPSELSLVDSVLQALDIG